MCLISFFGGGGVCVCMWGGGLPTSCADSLTIKQKVT